MRVISETLGIPEEDQVVVRDEIDRGMQLKEGEVTQFVGGLDVLSNRDLFTEYLDFRRKHPTDDLMSALIEVSFVDETGVQRHLDLEEILNYSTLLAAAGNETTTKLIGWAGYLLGSTPPNGSSWWTTRT